jgi:hypothetical protein
MPPQSGATPGSAASASTILRLQLDPRLILVIAMPLPPAPAMGVLDIRPAQHSRLIFCSAIGPEQVDSMRPRLSTLMRQVGNRWINEGCRLLW